MIVSVINLAEAGLPNAKVLAAIRAINRQIAEDFLPYWGFGGELRLEGRTGKGKGILSQADMRGDAVLYLWKGRSPDDVDGYHDKNNKGIPYGIVYLDLAKKLAEDWTVTFSHEALELIADPESNLLVQGPRPGKPREKVYHWFEMCDAVQDEHYRIDGIAVSNFVLPLYFTSSNERGGRNDFLGTVTKGETLRSFGVNPGGYVGFFDPKKLQDDEYYAKHDRRAMRRLKLKSVAGVGRGCRRRERTQGGKS